MLEINSLGNRVDDEGEYIDEDTKGARMELIGQVR